MEEISPADAAYYDSLWSGVDEGALLRSFGRESGEEPVRTPAQKWARMETPLGGHGNVSDDKEEEEEDVSAGSRGARGEEEEDGQEEGDVILSTHTPPMENTSAIQDWAQNQLIVAYRLLSCDRFCCLVESTFDDLTLFVNACDERDSLDNDEMRTLNHLHEGLFGWGVTFCDIDTTSYHVIGDNSIEYALYDLMFVGKDDCKEVKSAEARVPEAGQVPRDSPPSQGPSQPAMATVDDSTTTTTTSIQMPPPTVKGLPSQERGDAHSQARGHCTRWLPIVAAVPTVLPSLHGIHQFTTTTPRLLAIPTLAADIITITLFTAWNISVGHEAMPCDLLCYAYRSFLNVYPSETPIFPGEVLRQSQLLARAVSGTPTLIDGEHGSRIRGGLGQTRFFSGVPVNEEHLVTAVGAAFDLGRHGVRGWPMATLSHHISSLPPSMMTSLDIRSVEVSPFLPFEPLTLKRRHPRSGIASSSSPPPPRDAASRELDSMEGGHRKGADKRMGNDATTTTTPSQRRVRFEDDDEGHGMSIDTATGSMFHFESDAPFSGASIPDDMSMDDMCQLPRRTPDDKGDGQPSDVVTILPPFMIPITTKPFTVIDPAAGEPYPTSDPLSQLLTHADHSVRSLLSQLQDFIGDHFALPPSGSSSSSSSLPSPHAIHIDESGGLGNEKAAHEVSLNEV